MIQNTGIDLSIFNTILRISFDETKISLESQLQIIIDYIDSIPNLKIEGICIFLLDGDELEMISQHGLSNENIKKCSKIKVGHCLCGKAVEDIVYKQGVTKQHSILYKGIKQHGHYCLPIAYGPEVIGVLNIVLPHKHEKNLDELRFYMAIADILANVIKHRKIEQESSITLRKLRSAMGGIINAMAYIIEVRDPYTAGHQKRVSHLARLIATELKMSAFQIDSIRFAASIHDIGKTAVPSEILSKPSKLIQPEFDLIKIHPTIGYEILKNVDFPWLIAEIVYQHHEKIDGSGYPLGLKKIDIMIEAQIVCVSDIVEAMTNHRPYRAALGMDKAIDEIIRQSGKQLDADVCDSCLKVIRNKNFKWSF